MCAKGSNSTKQSSRFTGKPARRWLDTNGARTWLGAAAGLALAWITLVLHLPM